MPKINLYEKVFAFYVDSNHVHEVNVYLEARGHKLLITYYGGGYVYFNREKDLDEALQFKLAFGDQVRDLSDQEFMVHVGDDDDDDTPDD